MANYSSLSRTLTKSLGKTEKQDNGIYFTPPNTIHKILDALHPYMKNVKDVLEPSCGSCEFVTALRDKYGDTSIKGIEYNETIYSSIKSITSERVSLICDDFIKHVDDNKYDLIIGNPPYFVKSKKDVSKDYYKYFEGRPNIFILFIIKSLNMLAKNGILSFVLPKNFLNCLYYDKTRKYIKDNFTILSIFECNDDYIETKQDTINIIIKNTHDIGGDKYVLNVNDYTIFGIPDGIEKINYLYDGASTLFKMGFSVSVGTVVWNQCKEILTDDSSKTRLIYSSDIVKNSLTIKKFNNSEKKNYINKQGVIEPMLVVNRGYGVGNYKFDYCLIEGGFNYLIENHLICIKYNGASNKEETISLYKKIVKSLENEKTTQFIKLYFGNNAINTTELNHILPIYDI
jgi:type I restriction-modification system DNA methylase subunit